MTDQYGLGPHQRTETWPAQPPQYDQPPQPGYAYPPAQHAPPRPRKKRRVFMWVFLAIQVIFLIWVIAGAMTKTGPSSA